VWNNGYILFLCTYVCVSIYSISLCYQLTRTKLRREYHIIDLVILFFFLLHFCLQQAYTNSMPSALLASTVQAGRETDLPYSPFPVTQSLPTKYSNAATSISGPSISMSEVPSCHSILELEVYHVFLKMYLLMHLRSHLTVNIWKTSIVLAYL